MTVEVNNESGTPVDEVALGELARYVLDKLEINPLAEVSIVLLDAEAMTALHVQWMDLPGPTDVMAFPMDGAEPYFGDDAKPGPSMEPMLGDVVLCPPVAAEQAKAAGHSVEAELHLLCTHGILHLLGYDHGDAAEEKEMFDLQADLVKGWAAATGRGAINVPLPGTGGELRSHQAR